MDIPGIISNINPIMTQIFIIVAAFGGLLKAIEALLQFIAPFTKTEWDDNLATKLGKITASKVFNKK